ncbi:NUDIX domain-containing protein [Streptomyces sp. NPDC058683]|uniref:NUDIX domain-containing protein n=1 Tax=Streptomyces sp. NPDC058683 TaxID=3346597 RepID=UPI003668B533
MPLSHNDIRTTVETYLARHPHERPQLGGLLDALDRPTDIASRSTFSGHVTCGAIVVDQLGRVLHVLHLASGKVLAPGGHTEPEDESLPEAALRELHEETGIPPERLEAACQPAQSGRAHPRVRNQEAHPEHPEGRRPRVHPEHGAQGDQHGRGRQHRQQRAGALTRRARDEGHSAGGDGAEQRVDRRDIVPQAVARRVEPRARHERHPRGTPHRPQARITGPQPCQPTAKGHPWPPRRFGTEARPLPLVHGRAGGYARPPHPGPVGREGPGPDTSRSAGPCARPTAGGRGPGVAPLVRADHSIWYVSGTRSRSTRGRFAVETPSEPAGVCSRGQRCVSSRCRA